MQHSLEFAPVTRPLFVQTKCQDVIAPLCALTPSWRLWILVEGDDLSAAQALLDHAGTWDRFERVVLVHRQGAPNASGRAMVHRASGAIGDSLRTGEVFTRLRIPGPLTPDTDRVALLGTHPDATGALLREFGLMPGTAQFPAEIAA